MSEVEKEFKQWLKQNPVSKGLTYRVKYIKLIKHLAAKYGNAETAEMLQKQGGKK